MDAAELKKLQEANRKTQQRLALYEARDFVDRSLSGVRLPDAAKQRVRERTVASAPLTQEGLLDEAKFKTLIEAEVKDEAEYLAKLTGGRMITGMGNPAPAIADPVKAEEAFAKEFEQIGANLGLSEAARKTFAEGRA